MNKISSKAIEVFASGICIPIKAGYGIAVMSYALMECCPMSARMCDAGSPFLLEGLVVLGHSLLIEPSLCIIEYISHIFSINLKPTLDP